MSVTGEPGRLPQKVGVPIVDAAAAQLGAQAVLAALYGREKSGVGATLETSLLEVAMHLQAATWADYLGGAPEPTRIGDGQPHNAPAAEVVPTRDGHIVLSAYADDHWRRFCRVVGREELASDPRFASNDRRVANRTDLRAVLRECLSGLSSEECVAPAVGQADRRRRGAQLRPGAGQPGPDGQRPGGRRRCRRRHALPRAGLALPHRRHPAARPRAAPACGADSDALLVRNRLPHPGNRGTSTRRHRGLNTYPP